MRGAPGRARVRPRARLPFAPEIIGDPDCPILHRWTFLGVRIARKLPVKLLLHHFLPNADDRDTHDHPRPFWTFVLAGGYDDLVPCPYERPASAPLMAPGFHPPGASCALCDGGLMPGDRMRPGMLRFRPATYAHRTRVLPSGCWTIVVMGPYQRNWGFWREGRWWSWKDYGRAFGFGMRCGDEDRESERST